MICGWTGLNLHCAIVNMNNPGAQVNWGPAIDPSHMYGSRPSVIAPQFGGLIIPQVFAKSNTDSQLWTQGFFINWSAPQPLGGDIDTAPGAVTWGPGTMHIFARASFDGNIWGTYYDQGGWGGWFPL